MFAPQAAGTTINPALQSVQNAAVASPYSLTSKALPTAGESLLKAPVNALTPAAAPASPIIPGENFMSNAMNLMQNPSMQGVKDYVKEHPYATAGAAYNLYSAMNKPKPPGEKSPGLIRPYEFQSTQNPAAYAVSPLDDTSERLYFNNQFIAGEPYEAPGPEYKKATGGIVALGVGGPVEQMAALNAVGSNTGYPQAGYQTSMYSNPMIQRPEAVNVISPSGDAGVGA
jgi:hypothetical protein